MRSRSATVRMKASPFKQPDPNAQTPAAETSSPDVKAALSREERQKMFEDFGPVTFGAVKDSFSGDFSTSLPGSPDISCSTAATSSSCLMTLSRLSTLDDDSTEDVKPSRLFRGMVVGASGTGRHSLVNAICPEETNGAIRKQEFDLVVRKFETETEVKRLNFWVRETKAGQRYDSLVKMYYKTCKVFFLVYNTHDKNTFEVLNNEIQLIREANVGKELLFVLIGNKRAGRKCKVTYNEGLEFKKNNNIKLFLEADLSQEKLHNIMDIIHLLAK